LSVFISPQEAYKIIFFMKTTEKSVKIEDFSLKMMIFQ